MVVLEEFHSDSLPRYLGICFLIGMVPTNWGRTWTGGLINHRSHVWVVAYVPQIGSQFFVGECCARGIRCTFEISFWTFGLDDHWVTLIIESSFWIWFIDSPLTSLMPSLPFPRYRPCCAHLRYLVVQCTYVWYLLIACLLAAFICSYSFLFLHLYTFPCMLLLPIFMASCEALPGDFRLLSLEFCIVSGDQFCSNHGVERCSREPFDQF